MHHKIKLFAGLTVTMLTMIFATCKYSFKDVSPIPPEIKTFSVQQFENKATYINPQFAPQLTESVRKKISGQTRLTEVTNEQGDYDISGYVSNYRVSTSGVSNQVSSTNRLSITFHLNFKNTQNGEKSFETDVSTSVEYSADKTMQQGEQENMSEILESLSDAIFNKIFSNW